jgi:STE24 endopeptidase
MITDSHGFNKQDLKGWIKDKLKMLGLVVIISPIQYYCILWIINTTGKNFVIYLGIFITIFILLIMVLAPIFIMPLFYKFDPIEENQLKKDIVALAEDVKYPVQKIEVCDGSKKSGHSNAF